MLGEMAEVPVAGDQPDIVIDAGLGDQSVGQTGTQAMSEDDGSGGGGAHPIVRQVVEDRKGEHHRAMLIRKRGLAENLRQHHRRQNDIASI